MGAVWLADDTRLHRQVALKTLRSADNDDARSRARLMSEARAAAAINHPHIATVYDVLESHGQVVIVFEYVEGETLSARLARGPLTAPEAVELTCQIATALMAAHAQGIVHRDLKPANVIVGAGGQVKVLDFGIARLLSIGTTQAIGGTGQTASGPGFIGTPGYAAPEQMVSSAVDERADLYALGVMLFEMISGRRPFPSNDPMTLSISKLGQDAPSLSSTGCLVPADLGRIVDALLIRDRDRRPSSAADVLVQLRSVYRHSAAPAFASRPQRRVLGSAVIGAAVLVAAIAVGVWSQRPPPVASLSTPPVVAVLPFTNISGDSSNDFVAAGIAESLISSLAALPTVTVLSRASVAEARGRSALPSALAKDLGATYFVEGSLQESAGRLRVSLNLVKADRSVAWGDTVEGVFEQIFDLQSRLARALTGALEVRVSAAERQRMNAPPTASPEALSAYWQGRALLERRDIKGNVEAAVTAFQQAIAIDPRFALAQAALGESYWRKYIETNDVEWTRKAIEAGGAALRLDADQPEVRYTLAVTLAGSGRLTEAVEELNRALAMRPGYADARQQLGIVLAQQGEVDAAVLEIKKTIAQRPAAASNYSILGLVLVNASRYREAADAFEQMVQLAPDNFLGACPSNRS
jgi:eukaryotic-like serine/threonine-protein kinase